MEKCRNPDRRRPRAGGDRSEENLVRWLLGLATIAKTSHSDLRLSLGLEPICHSATECDQRVSLVRVQGSLGYGGIIS